MKNLFLNKELSLLAKQKGFKEMCLRYWKKDKEDLFSPQRMLHMNSIISDEFCPEDSYPAPLFQQIVDFFREEHNLFIYTGFRDYADKTFTAMIKKMDGEDKEWAIAKTVKPEKDYYVCLNKIIEEAFKLI